MNSYVNKSTTRQPAALLIAEKIQLRLKRRLAWLQQGQLDDAEAEYLWQQKNKLEQDQHEEQIINERLGSEEGIAWRRMVEIFGLSESEYSLLAICIALSAEPALGQLILQAQGAPQRYAPTESLVKRLFNLSARPIYRPVSPLATWELIQPVPGEVGASPVYQVDPIITDWLFGSVALDSALTHCASVNTLRTALPEWPVEKTARRIARALESGAEARLIIEGCAASGRTTFAVAVAKTLGRKSLIIDPKASTSENWLITFMHAQRFAIFGECALIWRQGAPSWPDSIPCSPLQFIAVNPGVAPPIRRNAVNLHIVLPEPSAETKLSLWQGLTPQLAREDIKFSRRLVETPGLTVGDLAKAAGVAPATNEEAAAHLRALARDRLNGIGRAIEPTLSWDDLILSDSVFSDLHRFAYEAKTRSKLLNNSEVRRIFSRDAALSSFFSGPPGIGKTMAAQALATELGVTLLIVDLGATMSKYIGETAKNLSHIFRQASASGAVLFFDEADALFAKRTDVKDSHDRHANADTNHLLQLLESYEGVVILASNKRANIDPAFLRRIRHVIEFPRAGKVERRKLWWRMVNILAGEEQANKLSESFDHLAATHALSPAQIKCAALSACYRALSEEREITVADLEQGTLKELAKEGRTASIAKTIAPLRGQHA